MILVSGAPVRAPSFGVAALAVAVSALLSACGGGGGGGGGDLNAGAPTAESSSPSSAAVGPGIAGGKCSAASVAAGDLSPSLDMPHCGSTADVGKSAEGLYFAPNDPEQWIFVGPTGEILQSEIVFGATPIDTATYSLSGTATIDAQKWTLDSGAMGSKDRSPSRPVTGSGSYVSRKSIQGEFKQTGAASKPFGPLDYHPSNALAVNQATLAGRWVNEFGEVITIGANGELSGDDARSDHPAYCTYSGSVRHSEPASAKNRYDVALEAVRVASTNQYYNNCYAEGSNIGNAFYAVNPMPEKGRGREELWILGRNANGRLFWDYYSKQQ